MLFRFAYLSVTSVFALVRLLLMSDRDKDVEILVLRHQVTVLQWQLGTTRPRFNPGDRAFRAPAPTGRAFAAHWWLDGGQPSRPVDEARHLLTGYHAVLPGRRTTTFQR